MELREAINDIKDPNSRWDIESTNVILKAVADGTLIPADAVFQVRDGYEVRAYGHAETVYGNGPHKPVPLTEALEIRSADDVRSEALEEALDLFESRPDAVKVIRALIDTPQPKAEPLHFDDWKLGISPDARINKLKPKGGDDV